MALCSEGRELLAEGVSRIFRTNEELDAEIARLFPPLEKNVKKCGTSVCPCGNTFEKTHHKQIYCSDECKLEFRKKKQKEYYKQHTEEFSERGKKYRIRHQKRIKAVAKRKYARLKAKKRGESVSENIEDYYSYSDTYGKCKCQVCDCVFERSAPNEKLCYLHREMGGLMK